MTRRILSEILIYLKVQDGLVEVSNLRPLVGQIWAKVLRTLVSKLSQRVGGLILYLRVVYRLYQL